MCVSTLQAQRHVEVLADAESIAKADHALEELFEILNYDFSYLGVLFSDFGGKVPADKEALREAAANASKICAAAALDFSIDSQSIFKHLRSDVLEAGADGADMLDSLLDSLNLTQKKSDFMQVSSETHLTRPSSSLPLFALRR